MIFLPTESSDRGRTPKMRTVPNPDKERNPKMKKRFPAFLLALLLLCSVCFATTLSVLAASNDNDYKNELWMMLGQNRIMVRGTADTSAGAPFSPENAQDTAYLPLDAVAKYAGATVSEDGSARILTRGTDKYRLTVGSTAWQKNGKDQVPFQKAVYQKDGVTYVSILSASALFGYRYYFDRDIGLVVLSAQAISYKTNDKTSLALEIKKSALFLFDHPTGEQVFADVTANVGAGAHPRLLVDGDRFDTLRALWLTLDAEEDPITDPDEIRLRAWVGQRVAEYGRAFDRYFVNVTGEEDPDTLDPDVPTTPGTYAKEILTLTYRQPYYFYTADGTRLLGLGGKNISKSDKYGRKINVKIVFASDGSLLTNIKDASGKPVTALYDERGYRVTSSSTYETTDALGNVKTGNKDYTIYGEGSDVGGRLGTASSLGGFARNLAFAYQITREKKYAEAVYQCLRLLDTYEHWGTNHFLNCADTASPVSVAFDWTYHAFDDEPAKRDEMARILYEKAVYMAYIIKKGRPQDGIHFDSKANTYNYYAMSNNWNTVCNSGIILSALALFEYDEYRSVAATVTGAGLESLATCLLQYAPDGAYIESPSYWDYGTTTYMVLLAGLESAAGTTYGYKDTVGLYKSFYFAQHITSPSGYYWNYHDSNRGKTARGMFYYASCLWDDPNLAAFRDTELGERGTGGLYDMLFYTPGLASGAEGSGAAPLDYYMKGIETVTMRSAWEGTDYTFAGLHAGSNVVSHGDHDSGNFYLEMGGKLWFGDPGCEDYNVNGYWSTTKRYQYYRKSQESHNTIVINNMPYGQTHNTEYEKHAIITDFVTEKDGSYAVADMTPQYGSSCTSGKRGLLFTNSRRTVVVQDEITFSSPTSLTWLAAPNLEEGALSIAQDGRVAYLTYMDTYGKRVMLRITLLSEDTSLTFTTVTGTLLPNTIVKSDSNPKASEAKTRLAIKANDVTTFDVAVVFEMVSAKDNVVGYRKTAIADWEITDDEWLKKAQEEYENSKPNQIYSTGDLVMAVKEIEQASYAERPALIARAYAIYLDMDKNDKTAVTYMKKYREYLTDINAMIRQTNAEFIKYNGEILSRGTR